MADVEISVDGHASAKMRWHIKGDDDRRRRRGPDGEERAVRGWVKRCLARLGADDWTLVTDPMLSWGSSDERHFTSDHYAYHITLVARHNATVLSRSVGGDA